MFIWYWTFSFIRLQKDVALISLANVLHRSRYSNEAAIVVHAALEVSRELNVNHFTLGNIYAVSVPLFCYSWMSQNCFKILLYNIFSESQVSLCD